MDPGFYFDMPADQYHADPCPGSSLSASVAKVLLEKTPAHAKDMHPRLTPPDEENDPTAAMDTGSAAHALMLHDAASFAVIDAADWRTKAAQAARDEARAAGKIPMLIDRFETVAKMVAAGRDQLGQHPEARQAFAASEGASEVTMVWQDGPADAPIWCRARIDWLPNAGPVVYDYKTTGSAAPRDWERQMVNLGHDVQAGFYCRGLRKLGWHAAPRMRFVVQETARPYALSVHQIDPHWMAMAERKADRAIQIWAHCLHSGRWPGYAGAVYHHEAPPYAERAWEDAEEARGWSDKLAAILWQAPDSTAAERVIETWKKATQS